jgi:hypothetical protein
MFRRRSDPAPVPRWRARYDAAREVVEDRRPPSWVLGDLVDVERALTEADADIDRLAVTIERLGPDRVAAELKTALRRPAIGPEHERLVGSLRERYEAVHRLMTRREELEAMVDRALTDLEVLAARAAVIGVGDDAWRLDDGVRRITDDLLALERAHDEVAEL